MILHIFFLLPIFMTALLFLYVVSLTLRKYAKMLKHEPENKNTFFQKNYEISIEDGTQCNKAAGSNKAAGNKENWN